MRALFFDGGLSLTTLPEPARAAGEALIQVRLAGICNTDLEIVRGYGGFQGVLGHEFVGEVLEADDAKWIGKRVCAEINLGCGLCDLCKRGMSRHCATRSVLGILKKGGCFTERITMPLETLHLVPDHVDDQAAVFVEPLAAAFEILEQVSIAPQDRVLVLGDGKLGLLIAMVVAQVGCELVLSGRHPEKLSLVEPMGARTILSDKLDERDFDVVIEATGSANGLSEAITRLRPRGTLVLKTTTHIAPQVDTSALVIHEITLVGSRCGPFAPAIRSLAAGRIDPRPLISTTLPLSKGVEAMAFAQEKGGLKVVLDPLER